MKHNILDRTDRSLAPVANAGVSTPKREKFSWNEPSEPGAFMLIHKSLLHIDGEYQREETSRPKVLSIARGWDWRLFGALCVIKRKDGTYWVYDGGHRTRASFFRDDIEELPCMVFSCDSKADEAKAFFGSNTIVSTMSAFHKHRAAILAKEPLAVAVDSLVVKYGYEVSRKHGNHKFAAINTLRKLIKEDPELTEAVWGLCVEMTDDSTHIPGEVLKGIFTCAKKTRDTCDILQGKYRQKLICATCEGVNAAIIREKHIMGAGGERIFAKAVLDLLNKGKQKRLTFNDNRP